jgi:hypothetical protein
MLVAAMDDEEYDDTTRDDPPPPADQFGPHSALYRLGGTALVAGILTPRP